MGAWGVGIFDDDIAMDFLAELRGSKSPVKLMKGVFEDASDAEYLEYDSGQSIIVSAAVIDTILNGTRYATDLEDLYTIAAAHKAPDVAPLKAIAGAAVRRVLSEGSELRELWEENGDDYPTWRANLESLASRLEG